MPHSDNVTVLLEPCHLSEEEWEEVLVDGQ